MPEYELAVCIYDGRSFPRTEEDFYRVGGLFDEEPRSTVRMPASAPRLHTVQVGADSRNNAKHFALQGFSAAGNSPAWNVTLRWQVEADRLRRVNSLGTSQIKLQGAHPPRHGIGIQTQ